MGENKFVDFIRLVAPELTDILEKRYTILQTIQLNCPIGRRTLSTLTGFQERTVRTELDVLRYQELIMTSPMGVELTQLGQQVLCQLDEYFSTYTNLMDLQKHLKTILNLDEVYIVPESGGILDAKERAKRLGKFAASNIHEQLQKGNILAVTGGQTMAQIATHFPIQPIENVTVIPARGGMGESLEIQANSVTAEIAKRLKCNYYLLHLPEDIDTKTMEKLVNSSPTKDVITLIKKADILVFGIGEVQSMAIRRGYSEEKIDNLLSLGAVAEAAGFFYDKMGKIVYATSSVGMGETDYNRIPLKIAVAAGENKVDAIISVAHHGQLKVLITDEMTAKAIAVKFT
jgi:central glycolytic genes regulator